MIPENITPYWSSPDGRHKILLADSYAIAPTLAHADLLLTDPPYEISAGGGGIGRTVKALQDTRGFTDCGFDYGVLKHFRNWVCFGTLRQVLPLVESAGADRRWMLVTWNKNNPCQLVNGNYLPDTEYIIHAWSPGCLYGEVADKARYIVHPLGDKEDGAHPNEKPVRVITKMVRLGSRPDDLVVDIFAGSGTTGIACIRTGRRSIMVEKV